MTESDCLFMAYADGELDADAAREVEHLMTDDPQAREAVENFRRTASLLRSACGEQVYATDVLPVLPITARDRTRRYLWAMAASVALFLAFGGGMLLQRAAVPDSLDEVAEYHRLFSRETTHLVELPADRVGELATWLDDRSPRGLPIPDLAAAGLRLAGGRLLAIDGERVAELMYTRDRGLPVGLCIYRTKGDAQPVKVAQRADLEIASWQDGEYAYVVVGELDPDVVRDLARRVATQSHG